MPDFDAPETHAVALGEDFPASRTYTPFSLEKVDLVLDLYVDGSSLAQICKLPEMPSYNTLLRWLRDRPECSERFEAARAARAIHLEEKALAIADNVTDASADRLRFDILKWGAEVGDPQKYGKKVTIEGGKRPVVFQIKTGVPEPSSHQLPPVLDATGLQAQPDIPVTGTPVPMAASSARGPDPGGSECQGSGDSAADPGPLQFGDGEPSLSTLLNTLSEKPYDPSKGVADGPKPQ